MKRRRGTAYAISAALDELDRTGETIVVERRGKPAAVIVPWDDYKALSDKIEQLSEAVKDLR